MAGNIFFQQLRRSRGRTWLNILLLAAAVAFFVMSANLYKNSLRNLETAEDAFTTIALMELYGEIDEHVPHLLSRQHNTMFYKKRKKNLTKLSDFLTMDRYKKQRTKKEGCFHAVPGKFSAGTPRSGADNPVFCTDGAGVRLSHPGTQSENQHAAKP